MTAAIPLGRARESWANPIKRKREQKQRNLPALREVSIMGEEEAEEAEDEATATLCRDIASAAY